MVVNFISYTGGSTVLYAGMTGDIGVYQTRNTRHDTFVDESSTKIPLLAAFSQPLNQRHELHPSQVLPRWLCKSVVDVAQHSFLGIFQRCIEFGSTHKHQIMMKMMITKSFKKK